MSKKTLFLIALFFIFVFVFNASRSLLSPPSHDEDQFIVSAAQLSKDGLLPYLDYPYFHVPNLMFVYAGIFKLVGHPFLSARLFSAFTNTLTAIVLFLSIRVLVNRHHPKFTDFFSAIWTLIFITNSFYLTASPLAWNHAFAGLLITASYWSFQHSYDSKKTPIWLFFTGALLSTASGTRATMILAIVPYLAVIFLDSGNISRRSTQNLAVSFLLGFIIFSLPVVFFFVLAPRNFIFGNIQYASLNTQFRIEDGYQGAFTFIEKLGFLLQLILQNPSNLWIVVIAVLLGTLYTLYKKRFPNTPRQNSSLVLGMILFLSLGSFLPTPSWPQYFYAPLPFIIIYAAECMSALTRINQRWRERTFLIMILVAILSISLASNEISQIPLIADRSNWQTTYVQVVGDKLRQTVKTGPVLTLSPVYAIEAGLEIYPQLTTGPFAWRTAQYLSPEQMRNYAILSEYNLNQVLNSNPPTAVLVGIEPAYERPISRYARKNGFTYHYFLDSLHLWTGNIPP